MDIFIDIHIHGKPVQYCLSSSTTKRETDIFPRTLPPDVPPFRTFPTPCFFAYPDIAPYVWQARAWSSSSSLTSATACRCCAAALYPVYTTKLTSSKHRANIKQIWSKHKA